MYHLIVYILVCFGFVKIVVFASLQVILILLFLLKFAFISINVSHDHTFWFKSTFSVSL